MSHTRLFAPSTVRARSRNLPLPPSLNPEGPVVARRKWRERQIEKVDSIVKLYQPSSGNSDLPGTKKNKVPKSERLLNTTSLHEPNPLEGLEENVFAHLLAEPPRFCMVTRSRVPRSFLVRLEYRRVPEEEQARRKQELESQDRRSQLNTGQDVSGAVPSTLFPKSEQKVRGKARPPTAFMLPISLLRSTLPTEKAAQIRKNSTRPVYIMAQESLVAASTADSGKIMGGVLMNDVQTEGARRVVDGLGVSASSGMGLLASLHWRQDMPDLVLKLMRKAVMVELEKILLTAENGKIGCSQDVLADIASSSPSELPDIISCALGPDDTTLQSIPGVGMLLSLKGSLWTETVQHCWASLQEAKEIETTRKSIIRLLRKVDQRNSAYETESTASKGPKHKSRTPEPSTRSYTPLLPPYAANLPLGLYTYPPRLSEHLNRSPLWAHEVDLQGQMIPVASGPDLLGKENVYTAAQKLLEAFGGNPNVNEQNLNWIAIRDTPETRELRIKLATLDGYLAKSI